MVLQIKFIESIKNYLMWEYLTTFVTNSKDFQKLFILFFSWRRLQNSSDRLFKSLRCLGYVITIFSYKHKRHFFEMFE